jgi:hypothetical protein
LVASVLLFINTPLHAELSLTKLTLRTITLAVTLLAGGAASLEAGPISVWYLTAGDQGTNWMVQAASANSFAQANPEFGGEYAVAVSGTVRTLGSGNQGLGGPAHDGSQYTLGGVYTGVDYPYPLAGVAFYDGTTNGTTNNFAVDFLSGDVYSTDLDWSDPSLLFSTGRGIGGVLGITYDASNDSIWISGWDTGNVSNYSMGGVLLSSFSTGFTTMTSLALDPADGTLWMGSQATMGTFYQFSKAGVLLDTETYAAMSQQNTLGGEFNVDVAAIPEPTSIGLLATGLVGLLARRYRRNRR